MASSSMPFPGRPVSSLILNRWGHWSAQALMGSIMAAILLRIRPIDPANPLSIYAPLTLMAFVVATWLMMRKHDRRLCEHCMTAMPLNPSASAARLRRRLALAHLGSNKRLVVAYFAVLIGSAFIPGRVGLLIWVAANSTLIYLLLSYTTHRRLQPWCPACRNDGGGDDDPVDSPDPVPHGYYHHV